MKPFECFSGIMMRLFLCFFFSCFCLLNLKALEADSNLDFLLFQEIPSVSTATLTPTSINDVPGSVTVISKKEIEYFGYQTLVDLYNRIPGFHVSQTAGNETCAIIRGFTPGSNEHIKLMIDGHHVTEYLYDSNWTWVDYPLCNVEQVEIIRGPGSCLYGANAISAVINIITDRSKRVSVHAGAGELGYASGNVAVFTDPNKDFSFSFTGDYLEENGDKEHYEKGYWYGTPFSISVDQEEDKRRWGSSLCAKYKNLELTINHATDENIWDKGLDSSLTQNPIVMETAFTYAELKYTHSISDRVIWITRFSYDYMNLNMKGNLTPPMGQGEDMDGDAVWDEYPADLNRDGLPEYWPDGMIFYNAESTADSFIADTYFNFEYDLHKFLLGFFYNKITLKDVDLTSNFYPGTFLRAPDNSEIPPDESFLLGEGEVENIYAVYFQDIADISETARLVLGTRYDDYSKEGSKLSPRTALIYKLPKDHSLKISYGESFFAPYYMSRYSNTVGFYGNPDIKSQKNQSYEISIQNAFQASVFYDFAFFYNKAMDIISCTSQGVFTNEGEAVFKGAEVEIKWNATNRFFIFTNYSYVDAKDKTLHSEYVFSTEHMGNLGFTYELLSNLHFSSLLHISGPQARLSSLPEGDKELDGWETVDASMIYRINDNCHISLLAKNLFDEKYYYVSTEANYLQTVLTDDFPAQGRKIIMKVNYKY